jgi:hypothetical protein
MTLGDALATLLRAHRALDYEQGRIARRNARDSVKAALRAVLRIMDREYPVMRKERKVRVSMSPVAKLRRQRAKTMTRTQVTAAEAVTISSLGINVETVQATGSSTIVYEAPCWAVRALRAGVAKNEIADAIRSTAVRKRIEAFVRLRSAPVLKPVVP